MNYFCRVIGLRSVRAPIQINNPPGKKGPPQRLFRYVQVSNNYWKFVDNFLYYEYECFFFTIIKSYFKANLLNLYNRTIVHVQLFFLFTDSDQSCVPWWNIQRETCCNWSAPKFVDIQILKFRCEIVLLFVEIHKIINNFIHSCVFLVRKTAPLMALIFFKQIRQLWT